MLSFARVILLCGKEFKRDKGHNRMLSEKKYRSKPEELRVIIQILEKSTGAKELKRKQKTFKAKQKDYNHCSLTCKSQ